MSLMTYSFSCQNPMNVQFSLLELPTDLHRQVAFHATYGMFPDFLPVINPGPKMKDNHRSWLILGRAFHNIRALRCTCKAFNEASWMVSNVILFDRIRGNITETVSDRSVDFFSRVIKLLSKDVVANEPAVCDSLKNGFMLYILPIVYHLPTLDSRPFKSLNVEMRKAVLAPMNIDSPRVKDILEYMAPKDDVDALLLPLYYDDSHNIYRLDEMEWEPNDFTSLTSIRVRETGEMISTESFLKHLKVPWIKKTRTRSCQISFSKFNMARTMKLRLKTRRKQWRNSFRATERRFQRGAFRGAIDRYRRVNQLTCTDSKFINNM